MRATSCRRGHLIAGENALRQGDRVRCKTCARVNARRYQARIAGRPEPEHGKAPAYSTNPLPGVNAPTAPEEPQVGPGSRKRRKRPTHYLITRPEALPAVLAEFKVAMREDPSYLMDMVTAAHRIRRARQVGAERADTAGGGQTSPDA